MALAAPGNENPSPAFLAGQAHGQRLAVQHAAPPKQIASPVRAPAKAPVTLDSALAQARQAAQQDTSQQVAALRAQQNLLSQQGRERAGQISAASQAAAQFLSGLGDQTGASYTNAAQTLAGLAQGYSGDVRDTATGAAAQIQAQLANLGAPSDSVKTPTGQTSQPTDLANVLYGLGGAIPGNLLVTSGQALAGAQRQLPAATLGYGQQQAAGTLASAQQQARDLIPQIVAAKAGQPKLVQQYLSAIQNSLTNQALAGSLIQSRSTNAGIAQQNANTAAQRAANAQANSDRSYQLALAKLSKGSAPKANASLSKSLGYLVDASGSPILQNGKKVMLPASTANKSVSVQRWEAKALAAARRAHSGWTDSAGVKHPPQDWQTYMTQGLAEGVPASIIIAQGRRVFTQAEIHPKG